MKRILPLMRLLLFYLCSATFLVGSELADPDPLRFAAEIDAFDAADERVAPTKGGIVLAGSSSIRLLDPEKVLPGIAVMNRGFGGAQISDLNHFIERCVLRYEPSQVVFYCGANDLWEKKPPARVAEDFAEFRQLLFKRVPSARLIVMAVRPSPLRESIREHEAEMNAIFKDVADADDRIRYVAGSWERFLNPDGNPIPELFADDQLHLSDAGYEVWTELLVPLLARAKTP